MLPDGIQAKIAQNKLQITETLLEFVKTDTLLFAFNKECLGYFSSLVAKANGILGTTFVSTCDLEPPACNLEQGDKLRLYLSALSFQKFLVLYFTAVEVRSVLLGVLLTERVLNAEEVLNAAFHEERYQQSIWGASDKDVYHYKVAAQRVKELEKLRDDDSLSEY